MGYLNKETVTVDAILTKKGRELLARGRDAFQVTKFAVADDEIDYSLYDPAHPLGTQFYGSAIENMPIIEASPDETQNMRFKLVTLPKNSSAIPILNVGNRNSIEMRYVINNGATPTILRPTTVPNTFDGAGFGYTAIIVDKRIASLESDAARAGITATVPVFVGDSISSTSETKVGFEFTIRPQDVGNRSETQLIIIGNQTGATITIPVVILPKISS